MKDAEVPMTSLILMACLIWVVVRYCMAWDGPSGLHIADYVILSVYGWHSLLFFLGSLSKGQIVPYDPNHYRDGWFGECGLIINCEFPTRYFFHIISMLPVFIFTALLHYTLLSNLKMPRFKMPRLPVLGFLKIRKSDPLKEVDRQIEEMSHLEAALTKKLVALKDNTYGEKDAIDRARFKVTKALNVLEKQRESLVKQGGATLSSPLINETQSKLNVSQVVIDKTAELIQARIEAGNDMGDNGG